MLLGIEASIVSSGKDSQEAPEVSELRLFRLSMDWEKMPKGKA